ncbi:MAG: hypothetical protein OXN89_04175 [Bryobacterales bacterium]|nr:hypothetical protein [Bryobacterales bacterium]
MQIDRVRLDRLMGESARDPGAVDAVLQQLHRCGVTQDMGSDALARQGRAALLRHGHVFVH